MQGKESVSTLFCFGKAFLRLSTEILVLAIIIIVWRFEDAVERKD